MGADSLTGYNTVTRCSTYNSTVIVQGGSTEGHIFCVYDKPGLITCPNCNGRCYT